MMVSVIETAIKVIVALSPIPTDFEERITQREEECRNKEGYSDVCIDRDCKFSSRRKSLVRHGCVDDTSTCRSTRICDRERVDGGIAARSENSSGGFKGRHRSCRTSLNVLWNIC